MDSTKIVVDKLMEKNYLMWSAPMEALMEARGVYKHISGEADMEGTQAGYAHQNNVARALIICSLSPQYVAVVLSEKDPKADVG